MLFKELSEQLVRQFSEFTQQSLSEQDQQSLDRLIQSTLAKANLVTRDEFDNQCLVLARTREKIEQLEAKYEEKLAQTSGES